MLMFKQLCLDMYSSRCPFPQQVEIERHVGQENKGNVAVRIWNIKDMFIEASETNPTSDPIITCNI